MDKKDCKHGMLDWYTGRCLYCNEIVDEPKPKTKRIKKELGIEVILPGRDQNG